MSERAALGEDEAYIGDLIGCTLVDVAGAEPVLVGAIEDVDTTAGPAPLLIVRRTSTQMKSLIARATDEISDCRLAEMALLDGSSIWTSAIAGSSRCRCPKELIEALPEPTNASRLQKSLGFGSSFASPAASTRRCSFSAS